MKHLRFLLVGPGRAGVSLASAWSRVGHRCLGILGGKASSRNRARRLIPGKAIDAHHGSLPEFDLLLLTPPDREIAKLAATWSTLVTWKGKRAIHASGSLSSRVLEPLRVAGASVASIHPITSLARPDSTGKSFQGIYFGVEGPSSSLRWAKQLARQAGGIPIEIPSAAKPFYHLCACIASGYLLALLDSAAARLDKHGVSRRQARKALLSLAMVTLSNAQEMGTGKALTGPVSRGDLATLQQHARAVASESPHWSALHQGLIIEACDLAVREGRISPALARKMCRVVAGNEGGTAK